MLRTTLGQTCRALGTPGPIGRGVTQRGLHASAAVQKTMGEKVQEVADKVNKGLGKGLASAIEKGEEVTKKTQEGVESVKGETKAGAERAKRAGSQAKRDVEDELGRR